MRVMRVCLIAAGLLAVAGVCLAQPAETAPVDTAPTVPAILPAESVLQHIPADALGFVVVNNIQSLTDNLDEYLAAIGLDELTMPFMPAGSLAAVRGMLMLGDGFNPNGGLAVVMLDPTKFGVDPAEIFRGRQEHTVEIDEDAGTAQAQPAEPPVVPLVVFVAGTSVEEVFGMYGSQPHGEYTSVMLPMGQVYGATKGGYVVLSSSIEVLEAALAIEPTATPDFGAETDVLISSELALYVRTQRIMPLIMSGFEQVQQYMEMVSEIAGPDGPPMGVMRMYFDFYRDLLSQIDSFAVGLRRAPTGLLIAESVSFQAEGKVARVMELIGDGNSTLLGALPDLPYIFAFGETVAAGERKGELVELYMEWVEPMFGGLGLSVETEAKIRDITRQLCEQVDEIQFVIGGAPAGSGAFGVSYVLKGQDSEKLRSLAAELAGVYCELINSIAGDDPNIAGLGLTYQTEVEVIDGVAVDAIVVSHPDLETLDESEIEEMIRILGEDKVRFFVAKADAETLVLTVGGSMPFLTEALAAAKGGGPIPADQKVQEVMKHMPTKPFVVGVFNVGNMFTVINAAAERAGEPGVPFQITSTTPIAVGAAIKDSSIQITAYVPDELVAEGVGLAKGFMMRPSPPDHGYEGPAEGGPEQF